LLALVAAVALLSGCGSDEISGQIPPDNAARLNAALDAVSAAVETNPPACDTATSQASAFVDQVNELPVTAGTDLKEALRGAGENLEQLVNDQCASTGTTGPSAPERPTTSSTTPTTSSTTESTTSTTTTDTTTSTTSTTKEPPPRGNGNGGGPPGGGGTGGTGGTGGGTGDQTGE
jgi:hypothetical protein